MHNPAALRKQIPSNLKPTMVTSDYIAPALTTYEAFRGKYNRDNKAFMVGGGLLTNSNIDVSWLQAASDTYNISADPRDYVLVDVPIVTVDIPNRNMQAFPYEEVTYFDPMLGSMVYQTFKGKACHMDHDNQDPLKAKGIHFDAALEFIPEYDVWKIRVLTGWDRTKDKHLVDSIINHKRTGFSMGAVCSAFVCSICGVIDTNINPCRHLTTHQGGGKGSLWDANSNNRLTSNRALGKAEETLLAYQLCLGVNYFETSSVTDPADPSADIARASNPIWVP